MFDKVPSMTTLNELSEEPKFTIKAVTTQTGIRAVTIRAWENRYGLLKPQRSENRYRLYTERDIAILRWVKSQVDQGISISNVVRELKAMMGRGEFPEVLPSIATKVRSYQPVPPDKMANQLYEALLKHDETAAGDIIRQANAMFDLTTVCMDVIGGSLYLVGEAWHKGDVRITDEHFASSFLEGKLINLLQAYPNRRGAPLILMACAPEEQHEIGVLMMSVLLRHDGYRVEYLGPDLPLDDIVDYARQEHPALICMSATMEENALRLHNMQEKINKIKPKPIFGYGGQAFIRKPALREQIAGVYMGDSIVEGRQIVEKLLG
jgi:MerR family transcriptional regulator, light-induced transcriptional regulator